MKRWIYIAEAVVAWFVLLSAAIWVIVEILKPGSLAGWLLAMIVMLCMAWVLMLLEEIRRLRRIKGLAERLKTCTEKLMDIIVEKDKEIARLKGGAYENPDTK